MVARYSLSMAAGLRVQGVRFRVLRHRFRVLRHAASQHKSTKRQVNYGDHHADYGRDYIALLVWCSSRP